MGSINVAIIGVGNCASSLVQGINKYSEADPEHEIPGIMNTLMSDYHIGDIKIVAAFDNDMAQYNSKLGNISVQSMEEIARTVKEKNISIGIVAVPSNQAQSVIDILVDNGITGILNYAPIAPFAPTNVVMKNIDPVLSLQSMTFYMKEHEELNQI